MNLKLNYNSHTGQVATQYCKDAVIGFWIGIELDIEIEFACEYGGGVSVCLSAASQ